jgi:hypothetical protein
MNKILIVTASVLSLVLGNFGASLRAQARDSNQLKEQLRQGNDALEQELKFKQTFPQNEPVSIAKAFDRLINRMRMLENYGGTHMELLWMVTNETDDLENYLKGSSFRQVRILPVVFKVNKYSSETDMGCVLNDIYALEKQTDLKVNDITGRGDVLEVKGELYGI